jgi:O-antigen/teichoic acid export membrane protein
MSLRKNSMSAVIASVLPAITTLIVTPLYLREIGLQRFGMLALFWLFVGYFGFFEGGIGLAASQRIASNTGDPALRIRTASTALTLSLIMGLLGGIVLIPVAYLYFTAKQTVETDGASLVGILIILAFGILFVNLSSLLGGILRTRSDHTALNGISAISGVLVQVTPLVVAIWWSNELVYLLASVIVARMLPLPLFYAMTCRAMGAVLRPSLDRTEVRALTSFGIWVTVSSLVSPLMSALDRFVLGIVQGPAPVASYSLGLQLSERTSVVPGAVVASYFPVYASANEEERKRVSQSFFKKYSLLIAGMTVSIILLSGPFLHFWVGAEVASKATPVAIVVGLGFWANMMARLPFIHLQAQGRPNLVAICHLIELPIYLAILYAATTTLGLIGGAVAYSLRCALDYALLLRLSGDGRREWARQTAVGGAMLLVAVACLLWWPK